MRTRRSANATHNMYAFRFLPAGSSHTTQDCEDDGEDHAGGRMLHLLQILDVVDVMVVVTRWYGGIHLGPDRFKHINNAARQILDSCGHINTQQDNGKKKKKGNSSIVNPSLITCFLAMMMVGEQR
ncbi:Protein IMPACT-B [Chionoecetes opilio]|uniref:Protein IMPACT-B n=1 Tax=Chionoecetes opilio TaxID=41210 RepID=A0A8J4YFU7_CHIOP|nr:Protein IMPACT-B [Chionoecetes opilio]